MGSELALGDNIQAERLDHYGLVASVCKDLGLAEKINKRFPNEAKAVIINGLGFTNRRLYLTHQFYEDKPLNALLDCDESIEAKEITDYTLANTLESIYEYGSTSLLGEIAYEIGLEEDLLGHYNHLDSTSVTVYGAIRW